MNSGIMNYIRNLKIEYPEVFENNVVIEFGALDVNGSPREIFDSKKYIGMDTQNGKGVDFRCYCHQCEKYTGNKKFDVVVSTEMLEHDPYWDLSILKMVDLLKIGGSLILTFAGPTRHEHGQSTYTPLNHYYRNISVAELLNFITIERFKKICVNNNQDSFISVFCYYKF